MSIRLGCLPIVLVIAQAVLIGMNLTRDTPAAWFWVLAPTWMTLAALVAAFLVALIHSIVKNPNRKDR